MNFDYSPAIFEGRVPKQLEHLPISNNVFDLTSIISDFENKVYISRSKIDNNNYDHVSSKIKNFINWSMGVSLPTIATLNSFEVEKLDVLARELENVAALFKACVQSAMNSYELKLRYPENVNICKICCKIIPIGGTCLLWEQHEHNIQIKVNNVIKKEAKQKNERVHNVIQSVPNPNSSNLFDKIPDRYKIYFQDLITSENNFLFCKRCLFKLPYNPNCLVQHFESTPHLQMYGFQNFTRQYCCTYCNVIIKSYKKWTFHLTYYDLHLEKCYTVNSQRKQSMQEYDCLTCNTVLYADAESIKKHIYQDISKHHRTRQKNGPKDLPTLLKNTFQAEINIESLLDKLMTEARNVSTEDSKCMQFLQDLHRTLSQGFPHCDFHVFGSRQTGLGDKDSDMDVFMDIDSMMYNGGKLQDPISQRVIVDDCVRLLRETPKGTFEEVHGVPMARTPIVRIHHVPTKLNCDLSFRHGLSVDNTHFISLCIELQPKLQGLILILKKWSSILRFRTHITNYAICILAIFYFQQESYLPSIVEMRKYELSEREPIEGWPTLNFDDIDRHALRSKLKSCDDLSITDILIGFFKYYLNFKFSEDVVCPLLGYPVKKAIFKPQLEGMPAELESYRQYVTDSMDPEIFRYNSSMCIQDPFELQHNVSKAVPYNCLEKFRTSSQLSFNYLENCKRSN